MSGGVRNKTHKKKIKKVKKSLDKTRNMVYNEYIIKREVKRNEQKMASIIGMYPCGEGAGYAGGIMSAAIDGIKVANAILGTI